MFKSIFPRGFLMAGALAYQLPGHDLGPCLDARVVAVDRGITLVRGPFAPALLRNIFLGLAVNENHRHAHPFPKAARRALPQATHAVDKLRFQLYSSVYRTGVSIPMPRAAKNATIVVSALHARTHFGRLLRQIDEERRSLVIEKRGTPRAILLSIRDYVRLAAPEPETLKAIGEESKRKGTDALSSRQIDRIIEVARAKKSKR